MQINLLIIMSIERMRTLLVTLIIDMDHIFYVHVRLIPFGVVKGEWTNRVKTLYCGLYPSYGSQRKSLNFI